MEDEKKEKELRAAEETAKIGEVQLSSTIYSAKDLLEFILAILNEKQVKDYLKVIPEKVRSGEYLG